MRCLDIILTIETSIKYFELYVERHIMKCRNCGKLTYYCRDPYDFQDVIYNNIANDAFGKCKLVNMKLFIETFFSQKTPKNEF
jgi:hypothetical protein